MATPSINRAGPVPRQQGIQISRLLTPANWIDSIRLSIATPETYTLPVDANGKRATILRLFASQTPVYGKWDGVAAAAVAAILDGTSSFLINANMRSQLIIAPKSSYTLSLLAPSAITIVTIEAWS